jgi:hypothetical protein
MRAPWIKLQEQISRIKEAEVSNQPRSRPHPGEFCLVHDLTKLFCFLISGEYVRLSVTLLYLKITVLNTI